VLAREQMIGIALVESRNGPAKPVMENYAAALVDAAKRFRLASGFIIATGFSGAARASSYFATNPNFTGVLLQGAGLSGPPNVATQNPTCAIYGIFGIGDPNTVEAPTLVTHLPATCIRRFSLQSGGHAQAQLPAFDEGMNFLLDTIYAESPVPNKFAITQYVSRFRILTERAKTATGITKYEALESANRIATARKLTEELPLDEQLHTEVANTAKQLEALAKGPAVAKELEARDAFRKVRDDEDSKWPMNVKDLNVFAKQYAPDYDAVAKKFPTTLYGKKAAARSIWLAKGLEK